MDTQLKTRETTRSNQMHSQKYDLGMTILMISKHYQTLVPYSTEVERRRQSFSETDKPQKTPMYD